ncbi:MAG: hypothetical protein QM754_10775 [Tepidisphaeraceae bacterium]
MVDRIRSRWGECLRLLRARERQIDADEFISSVKVFQRLKMLNAIDPTTELHLLGLVDACLDG